MGRIFISYRRDDNRAFVEHLADRLKKHFGKNAIFQDVTSIPPGVDFKQHVGNAVAHSDVEVVVTGRRWLDAPNSSGGRRLDDETDLVRTEIEAALAHDIPIIPVLIDGADMPTEASLPSTIKKLAVIQAINVRYNPHFDDDVHNLVRAIREVRLTAVRRSRRAMRRFIAGLSTPTKRPMIATATVVLLVCSAIALSLSSVLHLPATGGGDSGPAGTPAGTASIATATLPPTASIVVGWSTRHPGYMILTLSGFPKGSYLLSCTSMGEKFAPPKVSQVTVTVLSDPQTFDDGETCRDDHAGDIVFVADGTVTSERLYVFGTATPVSATPAPSVAETAGPDGATSFTDYSNAAGTIGPRVAAYGTVQVSCKVTGWTAPDGNNWWYRLASSPWKGVYYAPADNFYNTGQTDGSLWGTPFVDTRVPDC